MRTSTQAVFHGPGLPITLDPVPIPPLGPGEVLVRNEFTTLCRSDLNTYAGKRRERTPTVLGHEIVGTIAELGPGAPELDLRGAPLRVGDRITWAIYAADPCSCLARAGWPQKAADLFKYGHEEITSTSVLHGGLAEHCLLRRHTPIVRLDPTVPLPVLALINCAVATVAGSFRLAGPVAGRTVLIAGAGMLGVVACALARRSGAAEIIALDVDPARLATARRFGADQGRLLPVDGEIPGFVPPRAPESGLPRVAFDYSGAPATIEALLLDLGIGGTLVLVGSTFPQRDLRWNAERLVRQVQTIRGLHNYGADDLVAAVEFIERHHADFPFAELVADPGFGLASVEAAFAHGLTSGCHRVGLRCTAG